MVDCSRQTGETPSQEIEITQNMVTAALRVLRKSGALEYESLVDESLMRLILWVALAER